MQSLGERIKQARIAAGLSQRVIAERVGLSAMAISKYENDLTVPNSDVLIRLAEALSVKVGFFRRPLQVEVRCPAYRKHSRLGKKTQGMVECHIKELLERYLAAEQVFAPEGLPVFEWPASLEGPLAEAAEVEQWADGLREGWRLGLDPIANLCETLEDHGVKVILLDEVDDGFDGYSCWANGSIPVVACRAAGVPGDRQRFTLAHELGHLLLEDRVAKEVDLEKACHRFAGALLVPAKAVRQEVGAHRDRIELKELHYLKHKWGLSMQAWFCRLRDLGVVSEHFYRVAMKEFRASGWRRQEPGAPVPQEQTTRFERLVERAVVEDIISVARAADFLNKPLIQVRREQKWPPPGVTAA